MLLDEDRWADLRRFRGLYQCGAMSISAIARETGLHRSTVRKYLSGQVPPGPPRGSSRKGARQL
ncbi:helix-turn-helix domain-containing protein, partial [Streptomyces sp. NBRC 110611]|uniref:helix-turn-helix domain-containing protein n=1 Tax=Streptomyces sp. NBRC 110611 TaxID=1621259 RepID=UPI000AA27F6C